MDMVVEPEGELETERYISTTTTTTTVMYGESTLMILFCVAGLLANVPVSCLYFRSKHIRSITDKFLINLLLADIASVILLFPSILWSFLKTTTDTEYVVSSQQQPTQFSSSQNQGNLFSNGHNFTTVKVDDIPFGAGYYGLAASWRWDCALTNGILAGLAAASVLAALEIAMERYLAVVKPLHYHKFLTTPSILATSVIGGLISLATAIIASIEPSFSVFPHCLQVQRQVHRAARVSREILLNLKMQNRTEEQQNDLDENEAGTMTLGGFHPPSHSSNLTKDDDVFIHPSPTSGDLIWSLYSLTSTIFLFVIPVILMIYIYTKIWLEARRQKIKIANQYKPYFLSVSPEHTVNKESEGKKVKGAAFLPIVVKFRLMNRLRVARLDRAGRVAVVALFVTILCWSPYYFLKANSAIQTIMTIYGTQSQSYSAVSSNLVWSWSTTVLPLLFAGLHPLLSPLFYAYRYKRMRTEIYKWISSFCTSHDQSNTNNRFDGKSRSTLNTNSSSGGGTPCIRQAIITQQLQPQQPSTVNPLLGGGGNGGYYRGGESNNSVKVVVDHVVEQQDQSVLIEPEAEEEGTTFTSPSHVKEEVKNEQGHYIHHQFPPSHIQINIFSSDDDQSSIGNAALETDLQDNDNAARDIDSDRDDQSPNSFVGGIVRVERSVGNFFNYLNVWVNSYSRRWLQHRESVTSTASFITLLSSKYHNKTHTAANV